MQSKLIWLSCVSTFSILSASVAYADEVNTNNKVTEKQCKEYLVWHEQQNDFAQSQGLEQDSASQLQFNEDIKRECDRRRYDILGASKIRSGDFESLQDATVDPSTRLDKKRALIGNRFENGTKLWADDSDKFDLTLSDAINPDVSEAYKEDIASIEVRARQASVENNGSRTAGNTLSVPSGLNGSKTDSVPVVSSGVITINRASFANQDSSSNGAAPQSDEGAQTDPYTIEVFRGQKVGETLELGDGTFALSLDQALSQAAAHAPQIAVFQELPAIRETSVLEAEGRFKAEVFVESRYEDRDIPTTSLAQTAGDDRLRENDFATEFGIRKRVRSGAEITLSQRFSSLETNLIEFDPSEQSRSRSVVSVRQPILRGAGFSFNRALDNVAKLETDVAVQEFRRQSENHLLEVTRAYWNLYLARSVAMFETQSVERIDAIVNRVENRSNIDAQRLQVTRAKAARAEQRSSLIRARNAVRNAEARLRALISSPTIKKNQTREIIAVDTPSIIWKTPPLETIVAEVIDSRPEMKQANYQHKASIIRKGISANEALPQFDVILEGSLNGREDNFNFGGAINDANEGDYLVGVRFSMPIGRDERKARYKRRRLEELQQRRQLETTVTNLRLETEISINEYAVSYEEFLQRKDAYELAEQDYDILKERWQRGVGNEGVVFLDMLIDANRRLLTAQGELSEATVTFKYAEANLERTRGLFLTNLGYRIGRSVDRNGTPGYTLERTK